MLDMQPCQSGSRYRGIGRNCLELGAEIAKQAIKKGDEIYALLNGSIEEGIDEILNFFKENYPEVGIKNFYIPLPCAPHNEQNLWNNSAAEYLREIAIASLRPDFLYMTQIAADGWIDNTVSSINSLNLNIPTGLVQHDLIPLAHPEIYLCDKRYRDFYLSKVRLLEKSDLIFAISNYTKDEAIDLLGINPDKIIVASSGVSKKFSIEENHRFKLSYDICGVKDSAGFILCVPGGFDPRKNIERLIESYSLLPPDIISSRTLVVAGKIDNEHREYLLLKAEAFGITSGRVVLTGYVSDEVLSYLYRKCGLCVFPSFHEGFGLPVLEAMSSGAPVIASNVTSIPEVVGLPEALFDPMSAQSIADKMIQAFTDDGFLDRLRKHGQIHAQNFTWHLSAEKILNAIYQHLSNPLRHQKKGYLQEKLPTAQDLMKVLSNRHPNFIPSAQDISNFSSCYTKNIMTS